MTLKHELNSLKSVSASHDFF